jgi:flagellar hook-associated protein FlgK
MLPFQREHIMSGISSSLAGMDSAITRLSRSAQNISQASVADSGVNLDKEIVDSKLSSVAFEANAKVLKSQLDMEKRLLDILT